jgi:hypothetical protein
VTRDSGENAIIIVHDCLKDSMTVQVEQVWMHRSTNIGAEKDVLLQKLEILFEIQRFLGSFYLKAAIHLAEEKRAFTGFAN